MGKMNTKSLVEGALFLTVFIILSLLTFLPLVGLLSIVFLPIPIVIATYRQGLRIGILIAVASFFTLFVIGIDPIFFNTC